MRRADSGASLWPIELLGFSSGCGLVDATGWPVKLWSEHGIPVMGRRFSKRRDSRMKPRAPAEKSNYALGTSGDLEAGGCFPVALFDFARILARTLLEKKISIHGVLNKVYL